MNDHSRSDTDSETAALDRAVLDILLHTSHPWTETEITRALSVPGDIPAALARLQEDGLTNRWGEFAAPSYAALRAFAINHDDDNASAHEHREEAIVLELMLATTDGTRPLARQEVRRELGKSKRKRNRITDAIDRLLAAGLLDSSEDMLFLSRAALRYDQLTV
jgi:hypothetical protein